ncbi:MAG TPA: sodium/proton-translocating pyrophosphatase, partial [Brevefilum sp.]|nr:sodium/proton-translocating pyrophosphatase [Brevefilum sp.]
MDKFWLYLSVGASILSIGVALYLFFWVKKQPEGSPKAKEVASWIRDGSRTYLKRLYRTLILVVLILGFLIAIVFSFDLSKISTSQVAVVPINGLMMSVSFILGALCSAVAGYLGMSVAVEANVRTATAANESINKAFRLSFYAGSVMGLAMVGLAVLGMSVIFLITKDAESILGFSFGASTLALLAKAGGGIYTKTADIAADLVGKVEVGIPEDDPRNPAVVADNVGDNVGDVAGMGADIFDSYVAAVVAVMILGASSSRLGLDYVVLPLIICSLGILASLIGIQFVQVGKNGKPGPALNRGTVITTI